MEHTHVYVVFESCILEIEDEMSTELLFCAGVKVEDVFWGAFNPVNFQQLVANILSTHKNTKQVNMYAFPGLLVGFMCVGLVTTFKQTVTKEGKRNPPG